MLKPPINVFIAYGHDHILRDAVAACVGDMATKHGLRVQARVVKDETIRTGSTYVHGEINNQLRSVDGAIVILTKDDYAITKSNIDQLRSLTTKITTEALIGQMRGRARQNVIYEIGHLHARLGPQRCYIFANRDVELPSNLGDIFTSEVNQSNLSSIVEEYLLRRLKLPRESNVLRDHGAKLVYGNFCRGEFLDDVKSILSYFDRELSDLLNHEEKILYLYERIVFDSYLEAAYWWNERIDRLEIEVSDTDLRLLIAGLRLVTQYMAKWMPPEVQDFRSLQLISDELAQITRRINERRKNRRRRFAPIVSLVLYDYLALAQDKCARSAQMQGNTKRAIELWQSADENLMFVEELSEAYEDMSLPMWRGYSTFNRARVLHALYREGIGGDIQWRKVFQQAIDARHRCTQSSVSLPSVVRDGIFAEYHHAKVTRIALSTMPEVGEFAIDDRFVDDAKREFRSWLANPDQRRVRLARNVIDAWDRVGTSGST